MELVYLWVEEYKNIRNQGFNFSPRFECEYDKEKKELIIDKKEYTSIFPENINITAIVGENGSGKSNILDLINDSSNINSNNVYVFANVSEKTFFTNIPKNKINKNNTFHIEYDKEIYYLLEKEKTFFNPFNWKDKDSEKDSYLAEALEKDNTAFDFINEGFVFKFWQVKENKYTTVELDTKIKSIDENLSVNNIHIILEDKKNPKDFYLYMFTITAIHLLLFSLKHGYRDLSKSIYKDELEELGKNFTKENYLKFVHKIDLKKFKKGYQNNLDVLQDFDGSKSEIESYLEKRNIKSSDIQEFIKSDVYNTFNIFSNNNFGTEFIKIDYQTEKGLNFSDLSDGEKAKMLNFSIFINTLISDRDDYNCIFCLDEPDTFLHPNWQKSIINEFLKISKKYSTNKFENLHIILTSHSPFILSDVLKENVIFLKNGKQEYPFENEQTFGANIHTLLSHGFFMENGLMGEFAKEKIQSIINYHKELESKEITDSIKNEYQNEKQKEFWNIQSIIGDDYLKQVIKNHLIEIEKIVLGNDESKNQEITRLKEQIKKLEGEDASS